MSISFFHKTVEEFLAAVYIACGNEVSIESFTCVCSSLDNLMEISNFLLFMVGLKPSLGTIISRHIANAANLDPAVIRYRQQSELEDFTTMTKMELLFNMVSDCYQEMKYSQSLEASTDSEYHVSDVYISDFQNIERWNLAFELLDNDSNGIVSLDMFDSDLDGEGESRVSQTSLTNFLDRTSALTVLSIDRIPLIKICNIFSRLTVLSLYHISLTKELAHDLRISVQDNTQLKVLRLSDIRVLPSKDDQTCPGICLYLTKNKDLMTLKLEHIVVDLIDIKQCVRLETLVLDSLHFLNESAQIILPMSFAELKVLEVSCCHQWKDDLKLLESKNLHKLDLINVKVGLLEIQPDNLQKLKIDHVSCSLEKLLVTLPKCQNLTSLCIMAIQTKGDVQMLARTLPEVTHLQGFEYSALGSAVSEDNELKKLHADVAHAGSKLEQLQSIHLSSIDMEGLALTFSPLQTKIRYVLFTSVKMDATSWSVFVHSLRSVHHAFEIELRLTNLDDGSLSDILSSTDFKVPSPNGIIKRNGYVSFSFWKK